MSIMAAVPSTFMGGFVQRLIVQELPQFVVPCEKALTGQRLAMPDVSSQVLAQIRCVLAERAKNLEFSEKEFEEYFEERIAPVYHQVAPMVFAEV